MGSALWHWHHSAWHDVKRQPRHYDFTKSNGRHCPLLRPCKSMGKNKATSTIVHQGNRIHSSHELDPSTTSTSDCVASNSSKDCFHPQRLLATTEPVTTRATKAATLNPIHAELPLPP